MVKVYDLDKFRHDKYKLHFPVGKVYYYDEFKTIIIKNKLNEYLNSDLGIHWDYRNTKERMLEGTVQFLLTWYSTETYNNVYFEDISICMGLRYTSNLKNKYKVYYKVIARTHSISQDLDTFEQAFQIFEDTISKRINSARRLH